MVGRKLTLMDYHRIEHIFDKSLTGDWLELLCPDCEWCRSRSSVTTVFPLEV